MNSLYKNHKNFLSSLIYLLFRFLHLKPLFLLSMLSKLVEISRDVDAQFTKHDGSFVAVRKLRPRILLRNKLELLLLFILSVGFGWNKLFRNIHVIFSQLGKILPDTSAEQIYRRNSRRGVIIKYSSYISNFEFRVLLWLTFQRRLFSHYHIKNILI